MEIKINQSPEFPLKNVRSLSHINKTNIPTYMCTDIIINMHYSTYNQKQAISEMHTHTHICTYMLFLSHTTHTHTHTHTHTLFLWHTTHTHTHTRTLSLSHNTHKNIHATTTTQTIGPQPSQQTTYWDHTTNDMHSDWLVPSAGGHSTVAEVPPWSIARWDHCCHPTGPGSRGTHGNTPPPRSACEVWNYRLVLKM